VLLLWQRRQRRRRRRQRRLKFVISLVCNLLTTISLPAPLLVPLSTTNTTCFTFPLPSSLSFVCLSLLSACYFVAFTTNTTTTTNSNCSLSLSISYSLPSTLCLSSHIPTHAMAHSFIHLFILLSQPHAHVPHISRSHPNPAQVICLSVCLQVTLSLYLSFSVAIFGLSPCAGLCLAVASFIRVLRPVL